MIRKSIRNRNPTIKNRRGGRSLGYQDKGTVQVREGYTGQVAGGEDVQRCWPTKLEIVWGG